jgi:hypothetical protein
VQAAGRLGAGQGDDPAALGLGQPPGQARAGQVGQPVQPVGIVEAVQPLVHRLGVAAEPVGELGDAGAVPAVGDDAGALDQAGRRVPSSGQLAQGVFLGRVAGGRADSGGLAMGFPSSAGGGTSNPRRTEKLYRA